MAFRLRGGRWWYVAAAAGLAVAAVAWLIVIAPSGNENGDQKPAKAGGLVRLSAAPLGVDTTPWDGALAEQDGAAAMLPLLKAAGIRELHYGGSYSDYYDWQTNTNIKDCLQDSTRTSFTADCASKDALDFSLFSRQGRALGAQSFVSVNYGSGTPAEAAAWVRRAKGTEGEGVARWEVGNELYGCWEVDNELAQTPARYAGYKPNVTGPTNATCPRTSQGDAQGTQTLASSYAVNAKTFMQAMKAADPLAQLGVPWAFGDSGLGGAVPYSSEWNDTILKADGSYVSFVDAHYYPFHFTGAAGGANPDDQQILQSLNQVPALYSSIRTELDALDPKAAVVVGETNLSSDPTTAVCTPVAALFAAGDVLSWLAAGAASVDWWNLNNYGNTGNQCTNPDFGLFTSSAKPVPQAPYYGYLLASVLAQPHAQLGQLSTSDPGDVMAFQAVLPGGKTALAFINTSTTAAKTVTFQAAARLTGSLRTSTYSAGEQNAARSEIVTGQATAASVERGVTLPPESMMILQTR